MVALVGVGDGGGAASYLLILVALVPLTAWLLHGAMSGRAHRLMVLAALYGTLSVLYFQGLDDPSWKQPDPDADAFAISSGTLHALVALCSIAMLLTRLRAPRPDDDDRTGTR